VRPGIALAAVVLIVPMLWLLARLVGRQTAAKSTDSTAAAPGYSSVELVAGLSTGLVIALVGPSTSVPIYWIASAVACFATIAALSVGVEVGRRFADVAYLVPSGARVEVGAPGSGTAAGAFAAIAAAFGVVTLAHRLRLIGPGDGGLVILAVIVATLVAHWLAGRGAPRIPVAAAAALLAALLAAALLVLLP